MATKGKTPRVCRCGCGGMTKGGTFLPGHDAKMKGRLKKEARAGDEAAFLLLCELGWATAGERLDYLGNGGAQAKPLVVLAEEMRDGYEDLVHASDEDTPATGLKRTLAPLAHDHRIPRDAFERMWDRAMTEGWPNHGDVVRAMESQIFIYRDQPDGPTVVDNSHKSRKTIKILYRRFPCKACGHAYLVRQAWSDRLLIQHNCEKCNTPHYSTHAGLDEKDTLAACYALRDKRQEAHSEELVACLDSFR